MKQELTPLEFTHKHEQPKNIESSDPVGLREEEIFMRQKEIANETNIASIEEKVEIDKEMASLAKRREEIDSEKLISHGMQDSSVAKAILEERARIIIEGHEHVAKFISTDEGTPEPVGTPTNSNEAIARIESKAFSIIENLDKKVELRAEKIGVLDKVRAVGKKWNSLPRHYKLLFTAGLVLSGAGAAIVGSAVAGGAIATVAAGSRALAGAGLFASFEELLRRSHERKTGEPITEVVAARQAVFAGTLAILMVSILPTAIHNVLDGTGTTEMLTSNAEQIKTSVEKSLNSNLSEQAKFIQTAKAGDTVWKMSGEQLKAHYGEKFTGLPQNEQTRIIHAVEKMIVKQPELIGLVDAHKLAVGQSVDFGGILNDKEFINAQLSGTQQALSFETTNIPVENSSRSELSDKFNDYLVKGMTSEEAQAFSNEIGNAMAVNDTEKVFEIEGKMGITHEEFLRLVEETKKIDNVQQINSPDMPVQDVLMSDAEVNTTGEFSVINPTQQEIILKDPQVLAYANKQVQEHLNSIFGTRGFLGFGSENGIDSAHWNHTQFGFANKTVGEIMTAEPEASYKDGTKHFGIEDTSATEKMRDYLKTLFKETGLQPKETDTAEDYTRHAEAIKLVR